MVWFGELGGMMVHKKLLTVIRGALLVTLGSWAPALIKVQSQQKANAGAVDSGVTVSSSIIPLSLTLTSVLTALNAQICNHTFSICPIYLTHFPHLPLTLCMSAHSRARSLAAGTKHPIGWQHAQVSLAFPLNSPLGWITKWKWPQGFTGPPRSAHSSFSLSASSLLFSSGRTFT